MSEQSTLERVRSNLGKMGANELNELANNEGIREMWRQKQDLLKEMNMAKREAAEAAARPYREVLAQLETSYAVMLQLSASASE